MRRRREVASVGDDVAAACLTPVVRARGQAEERGEGGDRTDREGGGGGGPELAVAAAAGCRLAVLRNIGPPSSLQTGHMACAAVRFMVRFLYFYFIYKHL